MLGKFVQVFTSRRGGKHFAWSRRGFNKQWEQARREKAQETEYNPRGEELNKFVQSIYDEYARIASSSFQEDIDKRMHRNAHSDARPPWEED